MLPSLQRKKSKKTDNSENTMLRTDVKYERFRHENTQVYVNGYTPSPKVRTRLLNSTDSTHRFGNIDSID